jgi:serine protease AprX
MSLTRRNWFLHRVAPAGAIFGAAAATGVTPALAAQGSKRSTIDKSLRVHPFLQAGAQQEPDKKVTVIVQKRKNAKGSAKNQEIARAHGGRITDDFDGFINSFAMEIPQKAVLALAKNPNVAYISPNQKLKFSAIDTSQLRTTFNQTLNIPSIWNGSTPATGNGVTVAVLDSGVRENHADLTNVTPILINARATGRKDQNGHGTHVIGIVKGRNAQGRYIGVAPDAKVVSIQIADDTGASRECDLIRGLQWVNQNKTAYNIRVVNLSVNGSVPTSYLTSPICAAVETLWNRGVVVVVAAGNRGSVSNAVHFAPACDPFVLSVGALDNNLTTGLSDDSLAAFSSRGSTLDGQVKPEVVAPGRMIVSTLAANNSTLASQFPDRVVDSNYIRLSGTSMAAPVVAGVVALILERFPNLTAGQVKWLLTETMKAYPGQVGSAGLVDPVAALARAEQGNVGSANAGVTPNTTVADGMAQIQLQNSASFWDASFWDASFWDASFWDASYWDASYWDANAWEAAEFETYPD